MKVTHESKINEPTTGVEGIKEIAGSHCSQVTIHSHVHSSYAFMQLCAVITSFCLIILMTGSVLSSFLPISMGVESGGDGGDTSPANKISGGDVPSKNTHENLK